MRACCATRVNGRPCTARVGASGLCFAHDPELRAKRDAARKAGGTNRSTLKRSERRMLGDLRPVLDLLYAGLVDLRDGELAARAAMAMASVAGAIARIHEVFALQIRVEALEDANERADRANT